ncbi:succinylarginine dihydrolase [Klebsiella michiganensis]|uniref:Succinylarginine dihydrolase n=1 Tax=Klebsiella michiganensis TaxID=1134687 RepID=A0A7H4N0Z5_9ENTR|nr:succinylarginine dihydrolase [Klebsiella michiganensis]
MVPASQVSVEEAVATYLFNSQLLSKEEGGMRLILPLEAQEHPGVWRYLNRLVEGDNPIDELQIYDLRESMANGGGPACLEAAGGADGGRATGGESGGHDERYAVRHP